MTKGTKAGARPKHVPQRTCIACRNTLAKRELIRVVRTVEGTVEIDPTGKKNGRGAYIHKSRVCWDNAFKRKQIEHSLKVALTPENRANLAAYVASLPADESNAEPDGKPPG